LKVTAAKLPMWCSIDQTLNAQDAFKKKNKKIYILSQTFFNYLLLCLMKFTAGSMQNFRRELEESKYCVDKLGKN